jgi:hypothetical protein
MVLCCKRLNRTCKSIMAILDESGNFSGALTLLLDAAKTGSDLRAFGENLTGELNDIVEPEPEPELAAVVTAISNLLAFVKQDTPASEFFPLLKSHVGVIDSIVEGILVLSGGSEVLEKWNGELVEIGRRGGEVERVKEEVVKVCAGAAAGVKGIYCYQPMR